MKKGVVYIIILLFVLNFTTILAKNKKQEDGVKFKEVQIEYGDTIWDIAKNNMSKDEDIRDYIYQIRKINNLDTANIYPGKVILVPIK